MALPDKIDIHRRRLYFPRYPFRKISLQIKCKSRQRNEKLPLESIKKDEVFVRIHIRYRNFEGRQVAMQHAIVVHFDFHELSPILSVTIRKSSLVCLRSDPNIEYAGGDGAVLFW